MAGGFPAGRRPWAAWCIVPLALVSFGLTIPPPPVVRVHATVNGRAVTVDQPATTGRVLAAAGVRPRDGRLHAAVSGTVLGRQADDATITVNGLPAGTDAPVRDGEVVRTADGHDWIEATVYRTLPVPFTGLPAVETHAWRPGVDGARRQVVGARSGETVSDIEIAPAVAAHQVPGRVVTLSFDDGPNADWTPRVLDILRRRHVRAVFCVVGEMVDLHPDLVGRIADEGHRLCDHSVNHPDLGDAGADELAAEIGPTADRIAAITGRRPSFFRAPYGVFTDAVVDAAHAEDLRVLGWAVDTEDFAQPTPTTLVPALVDAVGPGAVILFHDGGGNRQMTVDALPYVITALRRQGYRFVLPGIEHPPGPAANAA